MKQRNPIDWQEAARLIEAGWITAKCPSFPNGERDGKVDELFTTPTQAGTALRFVRVGEFRYRVDITDLWYTPVAGETPASGGWQLSQKIAANNERRKAKGQPLLTLWWSKRRGWYVMRAGRKYMGEGEIRGWLYVV